MADVLYQLPVDQVADAASITIGGGTEDADYPRTGLVDGNVGRPAKLTTTTGSYVFDFGSAQRVDVFALGPHNLDVGLSVSLQGNATDAWGAPTLDAAVTIPALAEDGQRVLPWLDVTAAGGYSTTGFRYWRLVVTGTNSAAVAIGELWLGALKRTLTQNYESVFRVSDRHRLVEHATEYGVVLTYDLQVRQRTFDCTFRIGDTDLAALRAFVRGMKARASTGLWIPDVSVNDCYWVRLGGPGLAVQSIYTDFHEVNLLLDEQSQGLPL